MSKLIDAEALEKDGWTMNRIVQVDKDTMEYQTKKPTDFPPIEPEPKWIPCSETVDIPDREVLCCDAYGEELIGWLSYSNDQWFCESNGEIMYSTIAWREKPEPYREEGEQK